MPADQVVVAAAVLRDGRLLAARRRRPAALSGRWELPGGKVEPGEDERAALSRECREELDIEVVAVERVGPEVAMADGLVLRGWTARLVSGDPTPGTDHDAVRWLAPDELDGVDWLPPDRPVLDALAHLLGSVP